MDKYEANQLKQSLDGCKEAAIHFIEVMCKEIPTEQIIENLCQHRIDLVRQKVNNPNFSDEGDYNFPKFCNSEPIYSSLNYTQEELKKKNLLNSVYYVNSALPLFLFRELVESLKDENVKSKISKSMSIISSICGELSMDPNQFYDEVLSECLIDFIQQLLHPFTWKYDHTEKREYKPQEQSFFAKLFGKKQQEPETKDEIDYFYNLEISPAMQSYIKELGNVASKYGYYMVPYWKLYAYNSGTLEDKVEMWHHFNEHAFIYSIYKGLDEQINMSKWQRDWQKTRPNFDDASDEEKVNRLTDIFVAFTFTEE